MLKKSIAHRIYSFSEGGWIKGKPGDQHSSSLLYTSTRIESDVKKKPKKKNKQINKRRAVFCQTFNDSKSRKKLK